MLNPTTTDSYNLAKSSIQKFLVLFDKKYCSFFENVTASFISDTNVIRKQFLTSLKCSTSASIGHRNCLQQSPSEKLRIKIIHVEGNKTVVLIWVQSEISEFGYFSLHSLSRWGTDLFKAVILLLQICGNENEIYALRLWEATIPREGNIHTLQPNSKFIETMFTIYYHILLA